MNTPKLISPFSSPLAAVDASRSKVASAAPSLDFSRLLGDMRSELSVPARSNPQGGSASPRNEGRPSRVVDAPERREPASQSSVAGNEATRADAGSNPSSAAPPPNAGSQNKSADASAPNGSGGSSATNAASPADAAADPNTANTAAKQDKPAPGTPEENAQLAEAAAEAGVHGAVTATQLDQVAQGTAPVQTAVGVVNTVALAQVAGQPTATLSAEDGEAAITDPRLATLAALNSGTAEGEPAETLARMAGGQPNPAQQALADVRAQAATPQSLPGLEPGPVNPATLAAPVLAAQGLADTLSTQAAPLSLSGDVPTGAAALSLQLQEFNAMVAAARATSGTSLAPIGGFAEATGASLAPQPLAGLMPAGMLPGQGITSPASAGISAPLSSPQWPTELGRQFISITQAAKGLGQIAELRLDPPELGPLRITINLSDNVAHAVFSSPHALVRQTVENALPQLQQMLEQAGISLGQANVNDQHQSGQTSDDAPGQARTHGGQTGESIAGEGTETPSNHVGRTPNPDALVDTFA